MSLEVLLYVHSVGGRRGAQAPTSSLNLRGEGRGEGIGDGVVWESRGVWVCD